MRWLIEHGIDPARLTAQGFGPDRPIATNKTVVGRAKNRRVVFQIINGTGATAEPAGSRSPLHGVTAQSLQPPRCLIPRRQSPDDNPC